MRLHSAKVPQIAAEMVSALLSGGDVESESPKEVGLDIASVLNQYIRDEQEVSEQAKSMLAARGLPQTDFNRSGSSSLRSARSSWARTPSITSWISSSKC